MERDQIIDFVTANAGSSSDEAKVALGVATLAQRREFHGILNGLVWSGAIQGHQDHSYMPQTPEDDWDIRWEHLVVIPGAPSA